MKTTQLENMKVLILVFREDMLGGLDNWQKIVKYNGLNPCFSGRYAGSILLVILQLFRLLS